MWGKEGARRSAQGVVVQAAGGKAEACALCRCGCTATLPLCPHLASASRDHTSPAPSSGSSDAATTGRPCVRFQCHGWPPYWADAPASRLKRKNSQGTATQLRAGGGLHALQ